MTYLHSAGIDNLDLYRLYSHREIVSILRGVMDSGQLVKMLFNDATETIITTILSVDPDSDIVTVDCGNNKSQNKRIVSSDNIAFETTLDQIRIQFYISSISSSMHDDRPSFSFEIPTTLIRLQRRQFYRVQTPRETVIFSYETEDGAVEVPAILRDVSVGGIGLLDEKLQLDNTIGTVYENCRITFSDGKDIVVSLQVRNSQEATSPNGMKLRRIGCQFVNSTNQIDMTIQRYITKLERALNAKASGLV